jgi:hypothetical protein
MNLDINVIHMFMDGYVLSEEDVAHLDFGPKEAIFQKPKATKNHLKAWYMKAHQWEAYLSHVGGRRSNRQLDVVFLVQETGRFR